MKLIINISDNLYDVIKYDKYGLHKGKLYDIIRDGIPLNNMRAEIEKNAYPIVHGVNNHEKGMTLYGILQVIDKYKAESEK